jgi:hypothetical protein
MTCFMLITGYIHYLSGVWRQEKDITEMMVPLATEFHHGGWRLLERQE